MKNAPSTLVVVTEVADWPLEMSDVAVVSAREYLTAPEFGDRRRSRVINLCRSYRYQKSGYYVSLLGQARGHRPTPALSTIQDAKSAAVTRLLSEELRTAIDDALTANDGAEVVLCVYFGRESLGRYPALARALFGRLPLPLMRAVLTKSDRTGRWRLTSCSPLSPAAIPAEHADQLRAALKAFLRRRAKFHRPEVGRYDLAILADPQEGEPPSDPEALRRFAAAGDAEGFAVEFIERDDYARVAEFDALSIRETTAVNHRTFRFSQRAATAGLVVIDDPESILRCTNKVFLAEVLERKGVPTPTTLVAHRGNLETVLERIALPCVLKRPDSSFSNGVVKVETHEQFGAATDALLRRSDLIVAQAYTPTSFDWRIGVLGGEPLYACKYFMARQHWQIIRRDESSVTTDQGAVEAVALEEVPRAVVDVALRAAALMGDGLYGVDVKEASSGAVVIEVNDNPSIDAGFEDALLGETLYRHIMLHFRRRLDQRRERKEGV